MATGVKVAGASLTAKDYLDNKEWVKRIESFFDAFDRDSDGVVTINDLVIDVKKYSQLNPDPKVIEGYRLAQIESAEEQGVKPGISVTKEEYVKNFANLAPREVAKVRSGEGSIMHKALNKLFDVIDTNKDGTVSREEYRKFAAVAGVWDPSFIDVLFDLLDTNKNGKLERKELSDYQFKMLFVLEEMAGNAEVVSKLKAAKP